MVQDGKKPKKKRSGPVQAGAGTPRNPFAGRPQSGAGFHSDAKYGKKDRRREKDEIEAEGGAETDDAGDAKNRGNPGDAGDAKNGKSEPGADD